MIAAFVKKSEYRRGPGDFLRHVNRLHVTHGFLLLVDFWGGCLRCLQQAIFCVFFCVGHGSRCKVEVSKKEALHKVLGAHNWLQNSTYKPIIACLTVLSGLISGL